MGPPKSPWLNTAGLPEFSIHEIGQRKFAHRIAAPTAVLKMHRRLEQATWLQSVIKCHRVGITLAPLVHSIRRFPADLAKIVDRENQKEDPGPKNNFGLEVHRYDGRICSVFAHGDGAKLHLAVRTQFARIEIPSLSLRSI